MLSFCKGEERCLKMYPSSRLMMRAMDLFKLASLSFWEN